MRGGNRDGALRLVAREAKEVLISFEDRNAACMTEDETGGSRWMDATAEDGCCAAQHEGSVWPAGTCFGQSLQEDGTGCWACLHIDALSRSVRRQSIVARLCSAFFILVSLDVSIHEGDAGS